jgi:hypothetical protein
MTAPQETAEAGWTPDATTFGARLALIRQRMGWGNVEKAARECGIPVETWRSWERDNREPQRLTTIAMAIATKTGCDYLWLVHGPTRGAVRKSAYGRTPRVVATMRPPATSETHRPNGHGPTTRPVRQTRPIVAGSIRPLAASVL